MYTIFRTSSFKKQYKKLSTSDKELVKEVIILLTNNNEKLDDKYKEHKFTGNFKDLKECHVKPDLLLIYKINDKILELALVQVGNHSTLFK